MAYSIIISPRAQMEIENAVDYYAQDSTDAPVLFITALKDTYKVLAINPFFTIRYKNARALSIKDFPAFYTL